jgi:cytochrome c oxidase subunit 4
MSEQTAHAHDIRPYLFVFGALLVLTVVTVTVSYLHLPPGPAIALGLAIATIKAALVAAFFMHLKGERAIIYGLIAITVFFLIVLFVLPITDSNWTSSRRVEHAAVGAQAEAAEAPAR